MGSIPSVFLRTFPDAIVYEFEPEPRPSARFRYNVRDPRGRLFQIAIGAIDGKATFHVSSGLPPGFNKFAAAMTYPAGWDQSGSLRRPKKAIDLFPWCEFKSEITVDVRSLDSWSHENEVLSVDFIWADMQGAEGDLIRGGKATLDRARFLYVEYSNDEIYEGEPTLEELLEMLPGFRY